MAIAALVARSLLRRARGERVWVVLDLSAGALHLRGQSVVHLVAELAILLAVGLVAIRRARDAGLLPVIGALLLVPSGTAFVPALLLPSEVPESAPNLGPYRSENSKPTLHLVVRLLGGPQRAATVGIGFVGLSTALVALPLMLVPGTAALFCAPLGAGAAAGAITCVIDPRRGAPFLGRAWTITFLAFLLYFGASMTPFLLPAQGLGMTVFMVAMSIAMGAVISLGALVTAWIGRRAMHRIAYTERP